MRLELLLLFLVSTVAFAQGYSTGLPIPGLPKSVGPKPMAQSTSVTIATDQTPITVTGTFASPAVNESRFHDCALVPINGSAGAWVELGGAATLAANVDDFSISANVGQPTQVGVGPNAGAVSQILIANQGEGPSHFGVTLTAGSQLWIRSLSTTGITGGYITVNLSN